MPESMLQTEAKLMKLERLVEEREHLALAPLSIPEEELIARYETLYTGAVSDVLREFCLMDQSLPAQLLPLRPEKTVAGIAFTVKSAPNTRESGELTFRTEMLGAIPDNSVIV